MASRELNILVAAKGALKAAQDIGKVDTAVGRIGRTARQGLTTAAGNLAKIGVVAAGGAVLVARQGVQSLALLEDATTAVDGAIAQVGATWTTTSADIATEANRIESAVQAAFDDKDIVSGTANLIRFGHVTESNLRPAMEVMTDLAAKTGSVASASSLLGKALADPTKAAGKLSRYGVILTDQQQDQIEAMTEAGDVAGAQAVLLDALAASTKGAAAAAKGPYNDAINIMADVTEDAQRALGQAFLPVLEEVADFLSKELAKPGTMNALTEFGKGMAGALRQLIDIAKGLPWQQIGDAFSLMGRGAKAALDLFTGLPSWVQTAVVTGWGLNKLSGGALGSIVGELGKGLIKGVLGINAGVVNVNGPVAGGVGGGGRAAGIVGAAAPLAVAAGGFLSVSDIASGTEAGVKRGLSAEAGGIGGLIGRAVEEVIGDPIGDLLKGQQETTTAINTAHSLEARDEKAQAEESKRKLDVLRDKIESSRIATVNRVDAVRSTTAQKGDMIVAAIRALKLIVDLNVPVNVNVSGGGSHNYSAGGRYTNSTRHPDPRDP